MPHRSVSWSMPIARSAATNSGGGSSAVEVGVLERVFARLVDEEVGDALGLLTTDVGVVFDGGRQLRSHVAVVVVTAESARNAITASATAARIAPPIDEPALAPAAAAAVPTGGGVGGT